MCLGALILACASVFVDAKVISDQAQALTRIYIPLDLPFGVTSFGSSL